MKTYPAEIGLWLDWHCESWKSFAEAPQKLDLQPEGCHSEIAVKLNQL